MRRQELRAQEGGAARPSATHRGDVRRGRHLPGTGATLAPGRPVSNDTVLAQIAALDGMTIAELRGRWRELFGAEAPGHSRPYITSRLAYRIQELAYGGLRPETVARLDALADEIDREMKTSRGEQAKRRISHDRPIAGTRLIREWKGIEHCVTVLHDGFDYQGRRYKSLSAIARAITGTRWNGWMFFGLKNMKQADGGGAA